MDRVGRCYYCGSFTKRTDCLLQAYVYRTHQTNFCVCFPPAAIDPATEPSLGTRKGHSALSRTYTERLRYEIGTRSRPDVSNIMPSIT